VDIQALDLPSSGGITKSLKSRTNKDGAAVAFVSVTIGWFEEKAIGGNTFAQ
jgi:hypothetical protein